MTIISIILAVLIGLYARNKGINFVIGFISSLLLTPIFGFLVVILIVDLRKEGELKDKLINIRTRLNKCLNVWLIRLNKTIEKCIK